MLRAGNQNGKTFAASCEVTYHLTGVYPDWWKGKRFDHPVTVWASSETGESTRDNPQRALIGPVSEWGTGAIPRAALGDYGRATGVADLYDYVKVRHSSGGWSTLRFKYYAQGRQKWQGPPVHVVWFDEEPPEDIYDEGLARTIATKGIAMLTFTPLLGMSEIVVRFLLHPSQDQHDTNMTIEDADHIPVAERARIIASFPAHQREARAKGIPILGSGRVFPIEEDALVIKPIPIPDYWPRIVGLDFGWDHPTAAAMHAWDRDTDTFYVVKEHRLSEATPIIHAAAIKAWGSWIPVAWPHDGLQHDKGSGEQLAKQYKDAGLKMLNERATFEDGTNGVEAGLSDMLTRMQTGRWKVFNTCQSWIEEFRMYHRKDGKVVKERDDLLSASRYALMMKRKAIVKPIQKSAVVDAWKPLDPTMGW